MDGFAVMGRIENGSSDTLSVRNLRNRKFEPNPLVSDPMQCRGVEDPEVEHGGRSTTRRSSLLRRSSCECLRQPMAGGFVFSCNHRLQPGVAQPIKRCSAATFATSLRWIEQDWLAVLTAATEVRGGQSAAPLRRQRHVLP